MVRQARSPCVSAQDHRAEDGYHATAAASELRKEKSTANYVWYKDDAGCLGKGQFAVVFEGRNRHTGEAVAVKVCRLENCGKFLEDVNSLRKLKSQYITKYLAAESVNGSSSPKLAIVMELADGTLASELKRKANRKGIPKKAFLILVDHCVKALEYLHSHCVCHRDVKPANLLVFRRKEEPTLAFKLCDFGMMQVLKDQNQYMKTRAGTPAYALTCVLDLTTRDDEVKYTKDEADIWSTAFCFFEAATGRLPFLLYGAYDSEMAEYRDINEEIVELLRGRPSGTIYADYNEQTEEYDYKEEMPQQHKSYTKSFQDILCKYFQLLFKKDKEYLKLEKLSSLSEEMLSIAEHEFFCLNTATVESYCDTSLSDVFARQSFLDSILKIVQKTPGGLDDIHMTAVSQKIRKALSEHTIEIPISCANYKRPLIAVLQQFLPSEDSSKQYSVTTLRDYADGVRFEVQNSDSTRAKAVKKIDCKVHQLVQDESIPPLEDYLRSCTLDRNDEKERVEALRLAIEDQDYDAAETLLKAGVDANSLDYEGNTMLGNAASAGDVCLVKLLLWYGANVELQDRNGRTPFDRAFLKKRSKVAAYLRDKGAGTDDRNAAGWTPPRTAEKKDKDGEDEAFVSGGSSKTSIAVARRRRFGAAQALPRSGVELTAALHQACIEGHARKVAYLLDHGANICSRLKSRNRQTPLILAARYGNTRVVALLLNQGAKIDAADDDGETAVIAAASGGDLETVKTLVQNGANIMITANDGKTALHYACEGEHIETAAYLLDNGADVNARVSYGETPLVSAAMSGNNDLVEMLIKRGADVNIATEHGTTAIIAAIANGRSHFEVVKTLVQNGANVKAKSFDGYRYSALHYACEDGNVKLVDYLLENGASIDELGEEKTPLMVAELHRKTDVAQLLRNRGATA